MCVFSVGTLLTCVELSGHTVCVCVCAHTAAVSLQGLKFADTPVKRCLWFKWLVLTHMPVDEHAEVNINKVNTGM